MPDRTSVVVRGDLVPPRFAEEPVLNLRRAIVMELVALDKASATGQADRSFARAGPRVPSPQRFADSRARQAGRQHASDAPLGSEDGRSWNAAAAAAAMFIAGHRRAHLVAPAHRVVVEPAEVSPGRPDLDEPFELGIVPIENATPTADVRNKQMAVGVVRVGGPQLLERPGARLNR